MVHIQIVAGNEDRTRVLTKRVLKGLHQFVITITIRCIHMPCYRIYQSVVRLVHRQVHPVRFCDMNTGRHLQLTGLANQRLNTRIVNMNSRSVTRTSVRIAFALVAQLANTDSAHLMITLQGLASLLNTLFAHVRVVEAAPETEMVFVRTISRYILLKRPANPRAMHHCRVQYAHFIHRLAPLCNLFLRLCVIMSVHVDNIKLRTLDIRHRDIVHYRRIEILQQNAIYRRRILRLGFIRLLLCARYECQSRNC